MQKYFNYNLIENVYEINDLRTQEGKAAPSGRPTVISCLNPHSFVTALDDPLFRKALEESDYLLPDGEGIRVTLQLFRKKKINKIAGDDVHHHLLRHIAAQGGKVYYMGSTEEVLLRIKERLGVEYPGIEMRYFAPSYSPELPVEESMRIVDDINAFAPDIVFISMTAPKQEKWAMKYREYLHNTRFLVSIGAAFKFFAGAERRAPKWALRLKLEWLVRFIKDPVHMWKRNVISTPRFLGWVICHHKEM